MLGRTFCAVRSLDLLQQQCGAMEIFRQEHKMIRFGMIALMVKRSQAYFS